MSRTWRLRVVDQVERDLHDIAIWTEENFGARQADDYIETITLAIEALYDGPAILGARQRDDIGLGIRTLHVARCGRKGRHFVMFKAVEEGIIDVLRLLHDVCFAVSPTSSKPFAKRVH